MSYTKIEKCLACDGENLVPVLDLGNQPLANSYTKSKDEELPEFPLNINRCDNCSHVQLSVAVDPDLMFKDYLYVSGTSKTMIKHFEWFAKYTEEYYSLMNEKWTPLRVLDIGCNDGSQLDKYKDIGCITKGIDPAENLFVESSKRHDITCGYFDKTTNQELGTADIIIAQNVFAHNYDPLAFMESVAEIMDDNSLFFVQTSQANMILNNEFDTIYHEHISFYNIRSMDVLCIRAGLNLIDVTKCPLHGTSYVFVISKNKDRPTNLQNLIEMEYNSGLYEPETYVSYEKKCQDVVSELMKSVDWHRFAGYKIIGYGAAAKGNTLLNFSKIQMDYIIDDNTLKHNYYTPGSKIEIVSIDILDQYTEEDKILFIPLAWNFFKEIKSNIKKKRNVPGDQFLLFFPEVKVSNE